VPGWSPKERARARVCVSGRRSRRSAFCSAASVKLRVFSDGSRSRGIVCKPPVVKVLPERRTLFSRKVSIAAGDRRSLSSFVPVEIAII
jgi:hypothetical protein